MINIEKFEETKVTLLIIAGLLRFLQSGEFKGAEYK